MKISQLVQVVLINAFMAAPVMAASQPSTGSDAPISLCGDKADKADKTEKSETTVKSDKKNEKKEGTEENKEAKGSA
jgi:hypothetical protein